MITDHVTCILQAASHSLHPVDGDYTNTGVYRVQDF